MDKKYGDSTAISIVMPCLNEERTIGICVSKALDSIRRLGIPGEVVIADNGSVDNSVSIALKLGARVVKEAAKGYGKALMKGIAESRGRYILMGDADDSYDFSDIGGFVEKLEAGYDIVMGTRLKGRIEKGAMSISHRMGNPLMTWILNLFYSTGVSDVNCGMRAFTREAFDKLNLKSAGMEFASEFVVKAAKERLRIAEIPITLHKDGRGRPAHLRTFRDAWRHLRFLLIYSPMYLYLVPGFFMLIAGFFVLIRGMFVPFSIGNFTIDYHVNFIASVAAVVGFQICMTGLFARSFAYLKGFDKYDRFIARYIERFSLERSILLGMLLIGLGAVFFATILVKWIVSGFGPIFEVRKGIIGLTLFAIGFQYISSSFFLSMLFMENAKDSRV